MECIVIFTRRRFKRDNIALDIIYFPKRECFCRNQIWPRIGQVRAYVFYAVSVSRIKWWKNQNIGNDILTQILNDGKLNCFVVWVSLICGRRIMHINSHFVGQERWQRRSQEDGRCKTDFASKERQTSNPAKSAPPQKTQAFADLIEFYWHIWSDFKSLSCIPLCNRLLTYIRL